MQADVSISRSLWLVIVSAKARVVVDELEHHDDQHAQQLQCMVRCNELTNHGKHLVTASALSGKTMCVCTHAASAGTVEACFWRWTCSGSHHSMILRIYAMALEPQGCAV